jgi:hypothetical protein
VLEGPELVAALKKLVEIGRRLRQEKRANGCENSPPPGASDRHRD